MKLEYFHKLCVLKNYPLLKFIRNFYAKIVKRFHFLCINNNLKIKENIIKNLFIKKKLSIFYVANKVS